MVLPDETQLVQQLIEQHLVPLQSNQVMYTASAYTIQTLLKCYEHASILPNLQPSTREVITPYLSSHYVLKNMALQYHTPVYRPGMLYPQWACQWASSLLRFARSKLYGACIGLVSTGHAWSQVAHFLLPHLVLDVLSTIAKTQLDAEVNVPSPARKEARKRSSRATQVCYVHV